MNILVTGGAGYIGSHTVIELASGGHKAIVVDDLRNSNIMALKRVEKIISQEIPFYKIDLCNKEKLDKVFEKKIR